MIYLPKQQAAIDYLDKNKPTKWVLYGGAAGGGKTLLGVDWQIKRRLKYPKSRGLIGRAELKRLQLSTMKTFWEHTAKMNLQHGVHFRYNGQLNVITFYNGSEIILMDLDDMPSDPDFHRFGSIEVSDFFVDEVSECSAKCIDILTTRVRYKLVNGIPKGLMSCNPSKGWLYNEFFDAERKGRLRADRAFVPALPKDNPHLDPAYLESLKMLPEKDRKRLEEGDWDYDTSNDKIFDYDSMNQMFDTIVGSGQMYITCDPAGMGKDRTVIGVWHGLTLFKIVELKHKYPHEVADAIRELAQIHAVPLNNVVVDSDGLGIGVQGMLQCRKFLNGSTAIDPRYANMKSQCYYTLANYIAYNKVHITDHSEKEQIIKELDLIRDTTKEDGKKTVTGKEEIKKKHDISPDYADMIMMRMYFELRPNYGKYAIG